MCDRNFLNGSVSVLLGKKKPQNLTVTGSSQACSASAPLEVGDTASTVPFLFNVPCFPNFLGALQDRPRPNSATLTAYVSLLVNGDDVNPTLIIVNSNVLQCPFLARSRALGANGL